MLPPGIPDPTALQGMVTGKDLKALTEPYKTAQADAKAKNSGRAMREGKGWKAQWGKRSKADLELDDEWKEESEDWREQALALIWRMFRNTFFGAGTEGKDGDNPTEKTVYDVSGLSLHYTIWGQDGGADSDVVRSFGNPFYGQVFEYEEMRFGPHAQPLANTIYGSRQNDPADDWYYRMKAANHNVMSFSWLCNGEDPFRYLTAVKYGPHDSLAGATFGTPEIAEALASTDSLQYAKGVAEAAFGDAAMVTALRKGSLARATLGTDSWATYYADSTVALAPSVFGTTQWGEIFPGPPLNSDEPTADKTVVKAVFGTPELAQRFNGTPFSDGPGATIAQQLFRDEDGYATFTLSRKSFAEVVADYEARLQDLEHRLTMAGL